MPQSLLQPFALAASLTELDERRSDSLAFRGAVDSDDLSFRTFCLIGQQADGIFPLESCKTIKFSWTNDTAFRNDNLGTQVRFDEGFDPIAIRSVNMPNPKIVHEVLSFNEYRQSFLYDFCPVRHA